MKPNDPTKFLSLHYIALVERGLTRKNIIFPSYQPTLILLFTFSVSCWWLACPWLHFATILVKLFDILHALFAKWDFCQVFITIYIICRYSGDAMTVIYSTVLFQLFICSQCYVYDRISCQFLFYSLCWCSFLFFYFK